jgi:hypothetical protein
MASWTPIRFVRRADKPAVGHNTQTTAAAIEQALPGVWRWAAAGSGTAGGAGGAGESDRCGTALKTPDGVVLVDPAPLSAAQRERLEREAGPVRHVVLTDGRQAALAAPFRSAGVTVWAPQPPAPAEGEQPVEGGMQQGAPGTIDRWYGFAGRLPGGLIPCQLPAAAAPAGEVALLYPAAGDGLLMVGDVLPVVGQTPVYREGEAPPVPDFLDAIRALLAAEPGTLAPAYQAAARPDVVAATAWAGHIGSPSHRRRAAQVEGPRLLVPRAARVLEETLIAPVVERRDPVTGRWLADPFACARCGRANEPMPRTCGGPVIPRLCADCRRRERVQLPALRLMVCEGGCCTREGARAVASAARQAAASLGLAGEVDVVPVSCLGECSLGPFVRVATARGQEPDTARAYRERTVARARRFAADEGEVVDDESELVLSRFAAQVQPSEVARLLAELAAHGQAASGAAAGQAPAETARTSPPASA